MCAIAFTEPPASRAMSGSLDWKPAHSARPSSVTDRKIGSITPSKAKVSPSSFDMSGRNVRTGPLSNDPASGPGDRRVLPRTGKASYPRSDIRGMDATPPSAPNSPHGPPPATPTGASPLLTPFIGNEVTPFVSVRPIFDPARINAPAVTSLSMAFPFVPPPQTMWSGGMFKPGWHIGAYFRCITRRGLHHRVYEGPPDGTPRVRLGPKEITIDFSKAYCIKALFCNNTYSAVQFKARKTFSDGTTSNPRVWTNVRRGNDWWAEIVHASMGEPAPTCDDGGIGELIVVTPSRRFGSVSQTAPTVPAWTAD